LTGWQSCGHFGSTPSYCCRALGLGSAPGNWFRVQVRWRALLGVECTGLGSSGGNYSRCRKLTRQLHLLLLSPATDAPAGMLTKVTVHRSCLLLGRLLLQAASAAVALAAAQAAVALTPVS
jgi:hypothetical protein